MLDNIKPKKKIVYIPMAADILHPGHINIIKKGRKLGEVTVGLLTDEAIESYKRVPLMTYEQRLEVVKNIRGVTRVIPQHTLDYRPNLRDVKPDYLIHGKDWRTGAMKEARKQAKDIIDEWGGRFVEPDYTEGISSTALHKKLRSDLNKL